MLVRSCFKVTPLIASLVRTKLLLPLDDHDQAIADYNEAIKLDPKNAAAFRKRGNAYYDKGDMDRAIADYGGRSGSIPNSLRPILDTQIRITMQSTWHVSTYLASLIPR